MEIAWLKINHELLRGKAKLLHSHIQDETKLSLGVQKDGKTMQYLSANLQMLFLLQSTFLLLIFFWELESGEGILASWIS